MDNGQMMDQSADLDSLEIVETDDLKVGNAFHSFKFTGVTPEETETSK